MAFGPGKYDDACTLVREKTGAEGVIILEFNCTLGSGFSCQTTFDVLVKIPDMLRDMADQIEKSGGAA